MRAVKQVRGPSPCLHSILSSEQMEPVPPALVAARACIRSFGLGILDRACALLSGGRDTRSDEMQPSELVVNQFHTDLMEKATDLARAGTVLFWENEQSNFRSP